VIVTIENCKPVPSGHPDWRFTVFYCELHEARRTMAGVIRLLRGRRYTVRKTKGPGRAEYNASGDGLPALRAFPSAF
jgi:uncharacterized protein YdiU (UPF0061 family)